MAADVRNTEAGDVGSSCTSPLSCVIESCSIPLTLYDSDASPGSSVSSLPSYIIVQRQMEDVVLSQQATVERLVRNINVLNESKDNFVMVVSSQDQKIRMLENTIMEDYVPKEMYDSLRAEMKDVYVPKENLEVLRRNLQQEYESHNETAAKLQEVLNKLDASLTQVTTLTKQIEANKMSFDSVCESLRKEISEIQARNRDLESRLIEKTLLCDKQQCQIAQQQEEIEALQQKQQTQTMKYKHMAMEADVKKQQEVYLRQIFDGRNKKKM